MTDRVDTIPYGYVYDHDTKVLICPQCGVFIGVSSTRWAAAVDETPVHTNIWVEESNGNRLSTRHDKRKQRCEMTQHNGNSGLM